MEKEYKYWAFISYCSSDEKFAKRLHTVLNNYTIPKKLYKSHPNLPKKLNSVFLDNENLSADPDLKEKLRKELNESQVLIVICSPESAKSKWVNKEINDFRKTGKTEIYALIVDGEHPTDDISKECFPEALIYGCDQNGNKIEMPEPIAVDVRRFGPSKSNVKLISGILSVDYRELLDLETKRRKEKIELHRKQVKTFEKSSLWKWLFRALIFVIISTSIIISYIFLIPSKEERVIRAFYDNLSKGISECDTNAFKIAFDQTSKKWQAARHFNNYHDFEKAYSKSGVHKILSVEKLGENKYLVIYKLKESVFENPIWTDFSNNSSRTLNNWHLTSKDTVKCIILEGLKKYYRMSSSLEQYKNLPPAEIEDTIKDELEKSDYTYYKLRDLRLLSSLANKFGLIEDIKGRESNKVFDCILEVRLLTMKDSLGTFVIETFANRGTLNIY